MPLEHREYDDAFVDDAVDDPIAAQEHLAHVAPTEFGHGARSVREPLDVRGALSEALDPRTGSAWVVERDGVAYRDESREGTLGPARHLLVGLGERSEARVKAAAKLLVADDAAGVVVGEPLLDRRDEARLGRQTIEVLRGEQDGRGLAVLGHDKGTPATSKLSNPLGQMGLQRADGDDVFGYLE